MHQIRHDHFKGRSALEHIQQKKSDSQGEIHGDELPGHIGAFLDSLRDSSMLFLILWVMTWYVVAKLGVDTRFFVSMTYFYIVLGVGWLVWRFSKSAWAAWARLERLHRVLKEERYEIENHRDQERDELKALYATKGIKGELLDEVVDVLMADDDRLLRVMMEEEMGLNMENQEHPVKVGLFGAFGAILATALMVAGLWIWPPFAPQIVLGLTIAISGVFIAKLQKNEKVTALIWNLSFVILVWAVTFFISLGFK